MSFEAVCRLCLSAEGNMQPIFSPIDEELPRKIFECTTVEVKNLAGLPGFICEICKSELIIWMKFRRQCLRSNDLLMAKFPQLFQTTDQLAQVKGESPIKAEEHNSGSNQSFKSDDEIYIEIHEEEIDDEEIKEIQVENELETSTNSLLQSEDTEIIYKGDSTEDQRYDEDEEENYANLDESVAYEQTISIEIDKSPTQAGDSGRTESSEKCVTEDEQVNRKTIKSKSRTYGESCKVILPNNRVRYVTNCPICGKDQQNLKQHMRIHLKERPFQCSYCDKSFRQRGNYTRHVNIHTGAKPYKCTECDAAFADPASVRAHMVRHTGSREYHCDVCGKSFGHSHVLAAHKRIHTQDRRHSCTFCDKRFLSGHALKKHIRTHTGERPYQCQICPKNFATSGNLATHQRVHTKNRPFECNVCKMRFAYRCVLKTHMRTHSDGEADSTLMEVTELEDDYRAEEEENLTLEVEEENSREALQKISSMVTNEDDDTNDTAFDNF